jgi:hypothetical protein
MAVVQAARSSASSFSEHAGGKAGREREEDRTGEGEEDRTAGCLAAFSRLELSVPADGQPSARPLAEVKSRAWVRLRVFEATSEMLRIFACGWGG